MEDKEWVLKNVEEICADTRDVDEVCVALEHSTIFATETIQNLTQTILDLQQENKQLQKEIKGYQEELSKADSILQTSCFLNKEETKKGIRNIINENNGMEKLIKQAIDLYENDDYSSLADDMYKILKGDKE